MNQLVMSTADCLLLALGQGHGRHTSSHSVSGSLTFCSARGAHTIFLQLQRISHSKIMTQDTL
jgi:hypothetical protein